MPFVVLIQTAAEDKDQQPSDSVVVSALGMINSSKIPTPATIGTSDSSFPCLVAGVSIRKEEPVTEEDASLSRNCNDKDSVVPEEISGGDDAGTGGTSNQKLIFADAYLGDTVDANITGSGEEDGVGKNVAYTSYLGVYCLMYKGQPIQAAKKSGEKSTLSSSSFHKTQSMYFPLSQETQKLDLEDDDLAGYGDLDMQFSPIGISNPPAAAGGANCAMSKQVSVNVSAVQYVELPAEVQTNEHLISTVRTTLDEQYLLVVLSPHSGKIFERDSCDGGKVVESETPVEPQQNDLNKGSPPFAELINEDVVMGDDCGIGGDEVDGIHTSQKDSTDGRTRHPNFMEDMHQTSGTSGGFLLVYRLKHENQMIVVEEQPCNIHRISSPDDSLSYLIPLPSGVTDMNSDEESDVFPDNCSSRCDVDETDSPAAPSVGKWAALTKSGRLIIFDAASFSVLLSILPSEFDYSLAALGHEDKSNRYVALTFCAGMERLCVCTGAGRISFLQVNEGESSLNSKSRGTTDQHDSGKPSTQDGRLHANIDKSSE